MLLDSTFQVISMTTIVTACTLTLKDIHPITHIDHYLDRKAQSRLIGPFKFGSPARTRTADPMVNPAQGGTLPTELVGNGRSRAS